MEEKRKNEEKAKVSFRNQRQRIVKWFGLFGFLFIAMLFVIVATYFIPFLSDSCETMYDELNGVRLENWRNLDGLRSRAVLVTHTDGVVWSEINNIERLGDTYLRVDCSKVYFFSADTLAIILEDWNTEQISFLYTTQPQFLLNQEYIDVPRLGARCYLNDVQIDKGNLSLRCANTDDRIFRSPDGGFTWLIQ